VRRERATNGATTRPAKPDSSHRGGFARLEDAAAALGFPDVVFAHFLLVLLHLRFDFGKAAFALARTSAPLPVA